MFAELAAIVIALSQQPTQQDLARTVQNGSLNARHQAARDALQIPPEQRDEALSVTLANELQRVASESHARSDALRAGRQVPSLGEDHGDYYRDLVEAVSQWRDPRAIRPLISAGGGMLATRGIVRFGEAGVPPLIEAARTGHSSEKGGTLLALQVLLEGFPVQPYNIPPTPLSPAARARILQLARDLLRPSASGSADLPLVAGLALATGDDALRGQVEMLAREPGVVAQLTGIGDANEIARLQNAIRARLDRHQR